jgi:hypothetical protein
VVTDSEISLKFVTVWLDDSKILLACFWAVFCWFLKHSLIVSKRHVSFCCGTVELEHNRSVHIYVYVFIDIIFLVWW